MLLEVSSINQCFAQRYKCAWWKSSHNDYMPLKPREAAFEIITWEPIQMYVHVAKTPWWQEITEPIQVGSKTVNFAISQGLVLVVSVTVLIRQHVQSSFIFFFFFFHLFIPPVPSWCNKYLSIALQNSSIITHKLHRILEGKERGTSR